MITKWKWCKFIIFSLALAMLGLFSVPINTRAQELITILDEDIPLAGTYVRTPATGSQSEGNAKTTIDVSNTREGYIMIKYSGSVGKIKVQITKSGGTTYTYNLNANGSYEVFPLTAGDGSYTVNVYENVSGSQYSLSYGTTVSVSLSNSFLPFLYPSQYVNFSAQSNAVATGASLAQGAANDLEIVSNVYNYVVNNLSYDTALANQIAAGGMSGYLPNVDSVLASKKGICFDYAALMASMLRSQNIPTQLRVGYVTGGIYHAWINVYIQDVGWVNNVIYFDGQSWKLMDPTFASSGGQSSDIMQFIGNGANYSAMYTY